MENKMFTISVYSENNVGLLNRISGIFLKRHINILSLNVSESEIENVSRFIIVVNTTEKWVQNIVGQIEKSFKQSHQQPDVKRFRLKALGDNVE